MSLLASRARTLYDHWGIFFAVCPPFPFFAVCPPFPLLQKLPRGVGGGRGMARSGAQVQYIYNAKSCEFLQPIVWGALCVCAMCSAQAPKCCITSHYYALSTTLQTYNFFCSALQSLFLFQHLGHFYDLCEHDYLYSQIFFQQCAGLQWPEVRVQESCSCVQWPNLFCPNYRGRVQLFSPGTL